MENPSETTSTLGIGVGEASNGSGNGNGELNSKKKKVTGKPKKKNVTCDRNQLTTDKGNQVHYNFNKPINFNFQITLPESLFSSKKEVEKRKVQEVEEDEDYAYDYEDYEEEDKEDRDDEDEEKCYMAANAFAERRKIFVKPTIE